MNIILRFFGVISLVLILGACASTQNPNPVPLIDVNPNTPPLGEWEQLSNDLPLLATTDFLANTGVSYVAGDHVYVPLSVVQSYVGGDEFSSYAVTICGTFGQVKALECKAPRHGYDDAEILRINLSGISNSFALIIALTEGIGDRKTVKKAAQIGLFRIELPNRFGTNRW